MEAESPNQTKNTFHVFEHRGLPAPDELPEKMVGIYSFKRQDIGLPVGDRVYNCRAILTSQGWIPPADTIITDYAWKAGNINGFEEFKDYALRPTLAILDPLELQRELTDEGSVEPIRSRNASILTQRTPAPSFYIPDSYSEDQKAKYLLPCIEPALDALERDENRNHSTELAIARLLHDWYGVDMASALKAYALYVDENTE